MSCVFGRLPLVQEHFHSFAREQAGANKRKYAVVYDEDTPQDPVSAVDKIISEYEGYTSE